MADGNEFIPPGQLRAYVEERMSERQFMEKVIKLAKDGEWLYYHTHRSDRSPEGWFDLAMAREDHPLILAELKSQSGCLSAAQRRWRGVLGDGGIYEIHLWKPSDMLDIEEVLR